MKQNGQAKQLVSLTQQQSVNTQSISNIRQQHDSTSTIVAKLNQQQTSTTEDLENLNQQQIATAQTVADVNQKMEHVEDQQNADREQIKALEQQLEDLTNAMKQMNLSKKNKFPGNFNYSLLMTLCTWPWIED